MMLDIISNNNLKKHRHYLGRSASENEIRDNDGKEHSVLSWGSGKAKKRVIGEGGYGTVREYKFVTQEGRLQLVQKAGDFSSGDIHKQLEIHRQLKDAGLKTFDEFYTDSEYLYSTLLNKDGMVAFSANNGVPTGGIFGGKYKNERFNNLEIQNLDEIIDSIIEHSVTAGMLGLELTLDSLFFIVPEKTRGGVDIDFIIGDFDIILSDQKNSIIASLDEMKRSLLMFVREHTQGVLQVQYQKQILSRLSPDLQVGEFLTEAGVIPVEEYDIKEHGVLLQKAYVELDKSTPTALIERLATIPNVITDFTHASTEVKAVIQDWRGSIVDTSSGSVSYTQLESIGGGFEAVFLDEFHADSLISVGSTILLPLAKNISLDRLKRINGDFEVRKVKIIELPELEIVHGCILANGSKYISAPRLKMVVRGVHLREENFEDLTTQGDRFFRHMTSLQIELPSSILQSIRWGHMY